MAGERLNTTQKQAVVKLRGQGLSQRAVAKQVGCSQKTISRLENDDPQVKEAIVKMKRNIILKGGPLAEKIILSSLSVGEQIWQKAKQSKEPGSVIAENKEALDLAQKNVKAVIQPVGFSAAPGQPFFLQQINNDNRIQANKEHLESVKSWLAYKRDRDIAEAEEKARGESEAEQESEDKDEA